MDLEAILDFLARSRARERKRVYLAYFPYEAGAHHARPIRRVLKEDLVQARDVIPQRAASLVGELEHERVELPLVVGADVHVGVGLQTPHVCVQHRRICIRLVKKDGPPIPCSTADPSFLASL